MKAAVATWDYADSFSKDEEEDDKIVNFYFMEKEPLKFRMQKAKVLGTPIIPSTKRDKDENCKSIDKK